MHVWLAVLELCLFDVVYDDGLFEQRSRIYLQPQRRCPSCWVARFENPDLLFCLKELEVPVLFIPSCPFVCQNS